MQKIKDNLLWIGGLILAGLSIVVYYLLGKDSRLKAQKRLNKTQQASDAIDDKVKSIDAEIEAIDAKTDDTDKPEDFWNKL
jgi:peptidoglycan hydrolase CwlO-like protein